MVASALWNMEPTIDRAIKAVKAGKFKAEDYGQYSMMKHKGSRAGAARHVREEGAGRRDDQGEGQGRSAILDGKFTVKVDDSQPKSDAK